MPLLHSSTSVHLSEDQMAYYRMDQNISKMRLSEDSEDHSKYQTTLWWLIRHGVMEQWKEWDKKYSEHNGPLNRN